MKKFLLGLVLKHLPGLIPGVSAFLNPWVIVAVMGALSATFFYGIYLEHGRFEAHLKQDALAQASYEAWALKRNAAQAAIRKGTVDVLQSEIRRLAGDNKQLLNSLHLLANQTVLPPEPTPTAGSPGSGLYCFDRAEFEAGYRAIRTARADFYAKLATQYGKAYSVVKSCIEQDAKQRELEKSDPAQ